MPSNLIAREFAQTPNPCVNFHSSLALTRLVASANILLISNYVQEMTIAALETPTGDLGINHAIAEPDIDYVRHAASGQAYRFFTNCIRYPGDNEWYCHRLNSNFGYIEFDDTPRCMEDVD